MAIAMILRGQQKELDDYMIDLGASRGIGDDVTLAIAVRSNLYRRRHKE